eukprot:scaffold513855_cov18-Prasinocladus_malaysianus.AAC.1
MAASDLRRPMVEIARGAESVGFQGGRGCLEVRPLMVNPTKRRRCNQCGRNCLGAVSNALVRPQLPSFTAVPRVTPPMGNIQPGSENLIA